MMRIAGIEHPMQKRAYRFLGRGIPDMTIPNSSEITTPPKVGAHIKKNATPLINAPDGTDTLSPCQHKRSRSA